MKILLPNSYKTEYVTLSRLWPSSMVKMLVFTVVVIMLKMVTIAVKPKLIISNAEIWSLAIADGQ